jgi:hypothetical protein
MKKTLAEQFAEIKAKKMESNVTQAQIAWQHAMNVCCRNPNAPIGIELVAAACTTEGFYREYYEQLQAKHGLQMTAQQAIEELKAHPNRPLHKITKAQQVQGVWIGYDEPYDRWEGVQWNGSVAAIPDEIEETRYKLVVVADGKAMPKTIDNPMLVKVKDVFHQIMTVLNNSEPEYEK